MTITTEGFAGLAFPVVRVRYAGATDRRGSRYVASLVRDSRTSYRASVAYDSALPGGARQAIIAAEACYAKARQAIGESTDPASWVAIPGDLDARTYVFTFIPVEHL